MGSLIPYAANNQGFGYCWSINLHKSPLCLLELTGVRIHLGTIKISPCSHRVHLQPQKTPVEVTCKYIYIYIHIIANLIPGKQFGILFDLTLLLTPQRWLEYKTMVTSNHIQWSKKHFLCTAEPKLFFLLHLATKCRGRGGINKKVQRMLASKIDWISVNHSWNPPVFSLLQKGIPNNYVDFQVLEMALEPFQSNLSRSWWVMFLLQPKKNLKNWAHGSQHPSIPAREMEIDRQTWTVLVNATRLPEMASFPLVISCWMLCAEQPQNVDISMSVKL